MGSTTPREDKIEPIGGAVMRRLGAFEGDRHLYQ
jgi:hypothetical protein